MPPHPVAHTHGSTHKLTSTPIPYNQIPTALLDTITNAPTHPHTHPPTHSPTHAHAHAYNEIPTALALVEGSETRERQGLSVAGSQIDNPLVIRPRPAHALSPALHLVCPRLRAHGQPCTCMRASKSGESKHARLQPRPKNARGLRRPPPRHARHTQRGTGSVGRGAQGQ